MTDVTRGIGKPLAAVVLACSVAGLLRKVGRDYESDGRLSPGAAAAGWVLYLAHAALTLRMSRRSRPLPSGGLSSALGVVLAGSGLGFFCAGAQEFRSFEQVSGTEAGNLVTGGPYRYSRNPQVVGWGVALLGAALGGRSVRALLLVVAFFLVHRLYLVSEERHLERVFGGEYRRYRATTPRFLGLPRDG